MRNFFKKHVVANSDEIDTISIDERIYKDVYSAQELLLNEAKNILSKPINYDEERYNRLTKMNDLGFCNASEIKEFKEIDNKRKEHEKIKTKIEYYNFNYPLQKFIDKDSVEKICKKYNLLLTEVIDYIAEIPEKNQQEIIGFKVKRKDVREPYEIYRNRVRMPRFYWPSNITDYESYQNEMLSAQNLLIIAPGHKLKMENKIKEGHILKIKDPIVLQPVEEGYLIVSSWGLEASDELVVNAINN